MSLGRYGRWLFLLPLPFILTCWQAQAYFPFVTDDTGTQGTGGQQFEFDYSFNKERGDVLDEDGRIIDSVSGNSNAFPVTYTYGLSEDLDIFIGVARQVSPVSGWQNTEIGLKWVFAGDQTEGWSAALKPTIIIPVTQTMQDSGLGNASLNGSINLIASHLSDSHEVHFNLGYTSNRFVSNSASDNQRSNLWNISIAPIIVLNPNWKLGLDVGFQTNPDYNSGYQAFGGIGVQYAPVKNLQIGLGLFATPALNANANQWAYTINAGITLQF
jgi:hypothetical protein